MPILKLKPVSVYSYSNFTSQSGGTPSHTNVNEEILNEADYHGSVLMNRCYMEIMFSGVTYQTPDIYSLLSLDETRLAGYEIKLNPVNAGRWTSSDINTLRAGLYVNFDGSNPQYVNYTFENTTINNKIKSVSLKSYLRLFADKVIVLREYQTWLEINYLKAIKPRTIIF